MDDRMQKRLEQMSEDERDELKASVLRLEQQLDAKVAQLLYETQDAASLGEEDLEMRAHLLEGRVPLISDAGERIYKPRSDLTIQDIVRFAAFMDADTARRRRQIGEIGESSEN